MSLDAAAACLLGAHRATVVDGLWIALVALEAGLILGVLGVRVVARARARRKRERERVPSFSLLPS